MSDPLMISRNAQSAQYLLPGMANRHGCITGATGTGKTVTLQVMAEAFSRHGVPVFMADIKGDLTGISQPGTASPKLQERLERLGLSVPDWAGMPTVLWDVFGKQGHPVRATISDMGPLLLARIMNLNDTQEGVLNLTFKVADDNGLLLLDLKDLRAMLQFVADNAADIRTRYGNVSAASIGAIQRGLLQIETQGGEQFFGEPMLDIHDLLQTDGNGRGVVNILAADQLMQSPKLYSTFLLWLLSDLYEHLPEVGDADKPKLVFFFDEAHLLFKDAPAALLEKIEQVVRLIRSKGVGVYFVTQNPLDIPDSVLGQLGNRVQHALRAFTPRDQKAVRTAADTMRPNPGLDVAAAITELGVGEALISMLDEKGRPQPTERAWIVAPGGRIGSATEAERTVLRQQSVLAGVYEAAVDRESAYEMLQARMQEAGGKTAGAPATASTGQAADAGGKAQPGNATQDDDGLMGQLNDFLFGSTGPRGGKRDGLVQSVAKSTARSVANRIIGQVTRGILGSLTGGRRR